MHNNGILVGAASNGMRNSHGFPEIMFVTTPPTPQRGVRVTGSGLSVGFIGTAEAGG
jgi:hypothetical protein